MWEYTGKQQAAISVAIVLVIIVGLIFIPGIVGVLFGIALVSFLVWAVVFKMIPALFFNRF